MKVQYYTSTTLNGFIANEENSLDWLFALGEPESSSYNDFLKDVGAIVMGSSTYEWLLNHSAEVEAQTGSKWPYHQVTWVFSTRDLEKLESHEIYYARGPVKNFIEEIKAKANGKNIWIVGGGDLAGQFFDAQILDELILQFAATCLTSGKPVFPRETTGFNLELSEAKPMGSKFIELRYTVKYK